MSQHDEDMPDHVLDEIVQGLSDEFDAAINEALEVRRLAEEEWRELNDPDWKPDWEEG